MIKAKIILVMGVKKFVDILSFKHNRKDYFKKSCEKLRDNIDEFSESPQLRSYYLHFEKYYGIPKDVIQMELKSYFAGDYDYRSTRFIQTIYSKVLKSLFKFVGFFLR